MFIAIGALIVLGCVFGSFIAMGGNIGVLWQPFEFIIILGAATGALIIGNPMSVIKGIGGSLGLVAKGRPYSKRAISSS